jgi:hypothetical protein
VVPEADLVILVGCVRSILCDPKKSQNAHVLIVASAVENRPDFGEESKIATPVSDHQAQFAGRVAIANSAVGHATTTASIAVLTGGVSQNIRAFFDDDAARDWLEGCSN